MGKLGEKDTVAPQEVADVIINVKKPVVEEEVEKIVYQEEVEKIVYEESSSDESDKEEETHA